MSTEMKNKLGILVWVLCVIAGVGLLLSDCIVAGQDPVPETTVPEVPAWTAPADGNPEDETCLGSYTAELDAQTPVAFVGEEALTNGQLNVFYRLAIGRHFRENRQPAPSFDLPLEAQTVPGESITWQQYFLKQALEDWHVLQALQQKSLEPSQREEENFEPIERLHDSYMKDMPIQNILYKKDNTYQINKWHQEYLDSIPDLVLRQGRELGYWDLEETMTREFGTGTNPEDLEHAVWLANYAYMYFTELTYYEQPEKEEVEWAMEPSGETVVDLRHILLIPEGADVDENGRVWADEEQWAECEGWARDMVFKWEQGRKKEFLFANRAHDISEDNASYRNGGLYANIHRGQLTDPLDQWCFDPERQPGDVGAVRSDYGCHVLYCSDIRDAAWDETVFRLQKERMTALTEQALTDYPLTADYEKITLRPVFHPGKLSLEPLIYPDVAHERITEVPVYIQQDYKKAPYGGYNVSSHGCGITSLAMLSTYMSDTILTPGMLAARYGRYNYETGTDGIIFTETPPEMGYYVNRRTYSWEEAKQALWEGHMVICLQVKGYFTRGGHYLVLTKINPDDTIVIRDSNVFNYGKLPEHAQDKFPSGRIPGNAQGYWIFDDKILRIPFCSRCGLKPEEDAYLLQENYVCPKCIAAMTRRQNFLDITGIS